VSRPAVPRSRPVSWLGLAALVGDLCIFLLFAGIGRHTHGERGGAIGIVETAAPFVVAWVAVAAVGGGYHRSQLSHVRSAAIRAAVLWVPAFAIGMVLRSLGVHHLPPLGFAVVAFLFNGVLLVLWRGGVAWAASRRVGSGDQPVSNHGGEQRGQINVGVEEGSTR